MSIAGPVFEIFCDRCNSSEGVMSFAAKNKTAAWRQAEKYGWKRADEKDICPTCIELMGNFYSELYQRLMK